MNWRVPFFSYSELFLEKKEAYLNILSSVMGRGAFILQDEGREFERELARYLGIKHAFGVSNCTDALTLALIAVGIQPGDEVLLPSHTMVGTPDAVHSIGAVPVLVDCKSDHLMDPDHAKLLITKKTRAIIVVQLNGRIACMDTLTKLCNDFGMALIEDAAQAFGARQKGRFAGTFGKMGAFSFYPAKVLGCFGDGGALVTDDDALAQKIFLLRNHGCDPEGVIRGWGFNSRLDNIQAAILNFKLKNIEEEILTRRRLASLYEDRLRSLKSLILPPPPSDINTPAHLCDSYDVFQNYEIEAEDRDGLRAHLTRCGIGTLLPWMGKAVHQWEDLGFSNSLPATEEVFKKALLLPLHPRLSESDLSFVCDEIETYYGLK